MQGLICQNCGSTRQVPIYAIDNFFVCADCGHVIGYDCSGCQHFYENNHLGLHNDVYECKYCGKIQWGYTEYKKRGSVG